MDAKTRSARLWAKLLGRAEAVNDGNDCRISRLMGRSADFLAKERERQRGPSLENFLRLGQATHLPEWELLAQLLPEPEDPAEALRELRTCRQYLAAAFLPPPLDRLDEARAILENKSSGESAAPASATVRDRLAYLDQLRSEDPESGSRLVEQEIATQLLQLQSAKGADPAAAAALAVALALWSDQQRLAGRPELAFDACPKALAFAELADDPWARAHSLKAAAQLALEQGASVCAAGWLERARFFFGSENDHQQVARILALEGRILLALGKHRSAAAALREALAKLPASEKIARRQALIALAEAAQALGRPAEALACLQSAAGEPAAESEPEGELLWREAAARLALNQQAIAHELVGLATQRAFADGNAIDAGYALLELARPLVAKGNKASLAALAGQVVKNISKRFKYRKLARALENFYSLTILQPLKKADLEAFEKTLKAIAPPSPRALLPKPA